VTPSGRPPLDANYIRAALRPPWTAFEVVDETDSTNADLATAAPGTVLAAEYQRAGRGRLDRSWSSPPRAALLFSAALAPPVAPSAWGWLPLLAGVAACDAVAAVTGLAPALKWPNDLLLDEQKLAGILVQVVGDRAIIGIGLNVSTARAELPVDTATSLGLAGTVADRSMLLATILTELGRQYNRWTDAGGDADISGLAVAYRARCVTIGRAVTVVTDRGQRPATAIGVEDDGRLRVRWQVPDGLDVVEILAAGDIVHLISRT
jgi:BirA family biotin operon repressor/biotin-[acetyl-CoA-carboxylase] ligase